MVSGCKVTAKRGKTLQQKTRKIVQNLTKCAFSAHFGSFFFISGHIFAWSYTKESLEGSAECTLIFIATFQGNVEDGGLGRDSIQQMACLLHADVGDIALWCFAGNLLKVVTELGGAQCHLRCQCIHVHAVSLYLLGYEVDGTGKEVLIAGR